MCGRIEAKVNRTYFLRKIPRYKKRKENFEKSSV